MAEFKKSFLLYTDLIYTVEKLPDKKAGELFKYILKYVNDKNPETNDVIIQIAFEPIKQQLKRDLQKWESIKIKRSKAGKASANKKKQNQQVLTHVESVEQMPTKSTVSVNDNVTVSVNDNVINKNNKKIPSFDEFKKYAYENQRKTDTKKLELKYKAWVENDWKDGNNKKIINWKSKLLNTLQYLVGKNTDIIKLAQ